MNDDELNELIARSEGEGALAGNRGRPPPPLMQLEELPECYRTDEPFDTKEAEELPEGRGQRRRNIVSYNDGLSDDAWAMALEEGEDLHELSERAREKKERRMVTKLMKDAESSARATPASDIDSRGRKGRKGKAKATDFELPASGKRKRGNKSMSVTPSIAEDDDDDHESKRRKTKNSNGDISPAVKEKMKKGFSECHKAVLACEDETGRKRCELFRELPDKRDYPDYYQLITQPIAMSQLKKRSNSGYYKTVQAFRDDWILMFNNARTYNQEGSWVYIDAEEMEKVFNAAWDRVIVGSGLPGAPPALNNGGVFEEALTPMDDDDRPPPTRGRSTGRKQVLSDEEYLTPSDDE